ncbi:GNAT family N-acetyltransferase [Enterobacter sp. Bisph1]|uniref:GNAT family N-acetyltransferase n=1 Tax=Enterobacter sp. Bisph1 TaxID=1274399 RepID=UPI00057BF5D5|nr:GNAT family N-acetyltransferase [Enterobacter sp. Bisph1]
MNLVAVPAIHYSCETLAAIAADCFAGYSVPFSLPPAVFAQRFLAEDVNLVDSCVWLENDEPAAVALVARRGNSARLAAFAIRPQFRGQGAGRQIMLSLMASLRAKGVNEMWLEVLSDNQAAYALYHGLGFTTVQPLLGYQGAAQAGDESCTLQQCDPLAVVRSAIGESHERLPWLVDPLSAVSLPLQAFEYRKHAYGLVSTLADTPQLRFIYVEPEYRHKGFGLELLRALNQQFPALSTTVAVPERFSLLFERADYVARALSQYEMKATF